MTRPKTFDRTEMLDKAMELFWRRGYEATSIQDLLDHLGIKRQSLYDTFGDKHTLFMEALKRYEQLKSAVTIAILESPGSAMEAIRRVYHETVQTLCTTKCVCFLVNAAIELAPHDREVASCVEHNAARTEEAFYHALCRAHEQGELPQARYDLETLASFLNTALQGLNVAARSTSDPARLQAIAQVALSVLA